MRYFYFFISFWVSTLSIFEDQSPIQEVIERQDAYNRAKKLSTTNRKAAIMLLKELVGDPESFDDSIALKSCIEISKLQGLQQNFEDAFEYTIQALRIAEHLGDTKVMASMQGELGILYNEFGKEDLANNFLKKSLQLSKELYQKDSLEKRKVSGRHFSLAMHYRKFSKYDLALAHLDTCDIISKTLNRPRVFHSYHRAEQASIHTSKGNPNKALKILQDISRDIEIQLSNTKFPKDLKGFLTIIYLYQGDAYAKKRMYNTAIDWYKKSLENNNQYGLHHSNNSNTLEKIGQLYQQLGQYKKAYTYLKKSKQIADTFFGVTSKRNSSFLEIRNKYKEKIEKQDIVLLKQEQLLAQQKHRILVFQIALVILLALIVVGILLARNKIQRDRFKIEKQQLNQKQEEAKQALELKNKELTVFTLKLIEKEKVIHELSEELKLKTKGDHKTITKLKSLQLDSKALWEEFNSRFVTVNQGFYERLKTKFPDLTPTERKHCALIKLRFTGKQMAHLLSITEHSVHVSRYRLRKKMNLNKADNLAEFIGTI